MDFIEKNLNISFKNLLIIKEIYKNMGNYDDIII